MPAGKLIGALAVLLGAAQAGCSLGSWYQADIQSTVKTARQNERKERHTVVSGSRAGRGLELRLYEQAYCSGETLRVRQDRIREQRDYNAMAVVQPILLVTSIIAPFFYGVGGGDRRDANTGRLLTWAFVSIPLGVTLIVERFRQTERVRFTEQPLGTQVESAQPCETTPVAGVELDLRLSDGSTRRARTGTDGYAYVQVDPELVVDVYLGGKPLKRFDVAPAPGNERLVPAPGNEGEVAP